jgi:hypothetical protein
MNKGDDLLTTFIGGSFLLMFIIIIFAMVA